MKVDLEEESRSEKDEDYVPKYKDSMEVYSYPPAPSKSGKKGKPAPASTKYETCSEEGVGDKPCKIGIGAPSTLLKI